jgi:hypothetical protein
MISQHGFTVLVWKHLFYACCCVDMQTWADTGHIAISQGKVYLHSSIEDIVLSYCPHCGEKLVISKVEHENGEGWIRQMGVPDEQL